MSFPGGLCKYTTEDTNTMLAPIHVSYPWDLPSNIVVEINVDKSR